MSSYLANDDQCQDVEHTRNLGLTVITNQFDKTESTLKIKNNNLNSVNNNGHKNKQQDARDRWKLLACALRRGSVDSDTSDPLIEGISQRQFDGFNIVRQRYLPPTTAGEPSIGANAYAYEITVTCQANQLTTIFEVVVHHVSRQWTAKDLIGFNNTGNICVWPSEEALAYYALENIATFKDGWVLELGGGMTCLAGLMIAKYGTPYLVHLSDGNSLSVDNIKRTLRLNDFDCFVKCSQLKWENTVRRHIGEKAKYTTIICADCLFFIDSHAVLLDTIDYYLAKTGKVFVMAPKRSGTFDAFVHMAASRGFHTNVIQMYSYEIWCKHLQLKNSQNYNEDIHYPILVVLERND